MVILNNTLKLLVGEGIRRPDNLIKFNNNKFQNIAKTFHARESTLGMKLIGRLVDASKIVCYFTTVGCNPTPASMTYQCVIWKALEEIKDNNKLETSKLGRVSQTCSGQNPFWISYTVALAWGRSHWPTLLGNKWTYTDPILAAALHPPWAELYRLLEVELIATARHNHPLFCQDNASVCYKMEEATRGTSYAASIKPFQPTKNWHGA